MMNNEARHDDADKVRVDLIPAYVLAEVGCVFGFGAEKYGEYNWIKGMRWNKLYASALRHMLRWQIGLIEDKESGINHLSHAIANLMMLRALIATTDGVDDRMVIKPAAAGCNDLDGQELEK